MKTLSNKMFGGKNSNGSIVNNGTRHRRITDGQVSAEELAAKHIADMTARAADMAAKMIERMDANGDGQLSAEEMAQGPRAPTMFERADTDGDGAISKAEAEAIQDMMGHHGKLHRKG